MKFLVLAVFLAVVALASVNGDKSRYEQKRDFAKESMRVYHEHDCGTPESTRALEAHIKRCSMFGAVQDWEGGVECFETVIDEIEKAMEKC